jgi:hypothetical protein
MHKFLDIALNILDILIMILFILYLSKGDKSNDRKRK